MGKPHGDMATLFGRSFVVIVNHRTVVFVHTEIIGNPPTEMSVCYLFVSSLVDSGLLRELLRTAVTHWYIRLVATKISISLSFSHSTSRGSVSPNNPELIEISSNSDVHRLIRIPYIQVL